MPGTHKYRRVVWQDYYNSSSSNCQTTSYLERTAVVSSFLAVQPYGPGPLASFLPCMRVFLCIYWPRDSLITQLATLNLDRSTVGTQYRPLNWSNSHLTYLKQFGKKRVQHTLPAGSPGTVQARPRPPPTQSGVGEQDEGVSGRGVTLIAS